MDKLEVTYPCEWQYTVFGRDDAMLRAAVAEVFQGRAYSVEFSKVSKEGTYISLKVRAVTTSDDDRHGRFNTLGRHPAVKMVL